MLLTFIVNMHGYLADMHGSFENKKSITITNDLQKILDESNCKLWVEKCNEFYNRSMKS